MHDLDLFAGPGGWDVAAQNLGFHPIGIEIEKTACMTRAAAGHLTIRASVAEYPPEVFKPTRGLIASPPCQAFSVAGKRLGLEDVRGELVFQVVRWADVLRPQWIACEQVEQVLPIWKAFAEEFRRWGYHVWYGILNAADFGVPQTRKRAILMASQERFSAPKPTHSRNPSDDLFGEIKPWVTMAEALGWGITNRPAGTVASTTERGGPHGLDGGQGGRGVYDRARANGAWIDTRRGSSSEAVDPADGPAPTVTGRTANNWVLREDEKPEEKKYRLNTGRDWKDGGSREDAQEIPCDEEPAPAVTAKSGGQWQLRGGMWSRHNRPFDPESEPAPVVAFGHDASGWAWERPATTVVGNFRPDVVAAPGYRTDPAEPRQNAEGSIKVTIEELTILQSFPVDYPWQGSKTRIHQQIGNAIPPRLAEAILRELVTE